MNRYKIFAFTLAETLLTLTVAGVIMVLLLKSVNKINPDKEKILFLKTFHALETVVANTINDPTKYNQSYYTDNEINKMTEDEKSQLHMNFDYLPLASAKITFVSNGVQQTACPKVTKGDGTVDTQGCNKEMNIKNALCYFIADQMNTVGEVNCDNNSGIQVEGEKQSGLNMRFTNGACIGWVHGGANSEGLQSFSIVPSCNGSDKNLRYAVYVSPDGKLTVPETNENANQAKAWAWMNEQTTVK